MTRIKLFFFFLIIAVLPACRKKKAVCDTEKHYKYQPEIPAYWKLFNNASGWIGADGAYSIPLSPQKTLWIYDDTWHGTICDNKRINATISAHNTIAIQDGTDPSTATLKYYFGKNNGSFFTPSDNKGFLWTLHGTLVGTTLYLFMMQVIATNSNTLGFQLTGSRIIKITNPLDPPGQWKMTQYAVPHAVFTSAATTFFGNTVIKQDGYVYMFGITSESTVYDRYVLLARAPQDSVVEFNSWKFYNNGQWQADLGLAQHITDGVGVEFSVSYQPKTKKYVLITTELGFSDKINMRTSDALWSGWSAPKTVYRCPELLWGDNIFCYAAKGHAEISNDEELIITYSSNSFSISDNVNNAEIYWTRFIKIAF